MICPYCNSSNVSCDMVDIGIGEIQCGPYGCDDCHASQVHPDTPKIELYRIESEFGWHQPPIETAPHHEVILARDSDGHEHFVKWSDQRYGDMGPRLDPFPPGFVCDGHPIEDLVSWRPHESNA